MALLGVVSEMASIIWLCDAKELTSFGSELKSHHMRLQQHELTSYIWLSFPFSVTRVTYCLVGLGLCRAQPWKFSSVPGKQGWLLTLFIPLDIKLSTSLRQHLKYYPKISFERIGWCAMLFGAGVRGRVTNTKYWSICHWTLAIYIKIDD